MDSCLIIYFLNSLNLFCLSSSSIKAYEPLLINLELLFSRSFYFDLLKIGLARFALDLSRLLSIFDLTLWILGSRGLYWYGLVLRVLKPIELAIVFLTEGRFLVYEKGILIWGFLVPILLIVSKSLAFSLCTGFPLILALGNCSVPMLPCLLLNVFVG